LTERLCGASRPGHFDGVATVVTKLFNIVQPDRAYFGLKDAQQVAVIEQMVRDLNIPVEIVPCETVREADGLAMSSRNVYLSTEERKQATILYQALREAKVGLESGRFRTAEEVNRFVREKIMTQPLAEIDYVETLSYPRLEPPENLESERIIVAVAVRFGKTRLIDNLLFGKKGRD
jgi:pantoate--beta-alanine ligase